MQVGIGIGEIAGPDAGLEAMVEQARAAEADGFDSAWVANIFGLDAMTAVTVCARETTTLKLGTAVVPSYPRHPMAMAQQALSTQVATKGRFTLGIGLSHQVVIEGMFGMSYAKSYSHMKEYLQVLMPLVHEGKVSHQGPLYSVNGRLSVRHPTQLPVVIAALAPKMLALAGTVADGTVTWMVGPKTLESHTIPRLNEAAAAAGRPTPKVVVGLPVAVTDDVEAARAKAARGFQTYGMLPSYRAMLDREGAKGPADVAIVGDADAVGEQLGKLAEIGVTDFQAVPFPVGEDKPASLARTREALVAYLKSR
ncbi:MAG: TIGR03564 family F420-dependent LLM class oxidoreductase [Myxococcales bacterium]|nr:TIGR03564 family F420-dependent LLM class oxidoreductase [Myxococcales bacterium]